MKIIDWAAWDIEDGKACEFCGTNSDRVYYWLIVLEDGREVLACEPCFKKVPVYGKTGPIEIK